MAAPPVCRNCGSALPRAALFCPHCNRAVFLLTGRRARSARNASVLGMAGSLLMVLQGAFMLVGGAIALVALRLAAYGDLSGGLATAVGAAVFVGVTLLFDLAGISLLVGAFYLHTRTARARATLAPPDPERLALARRGMLATVFLLAWLGVTLAWRIALAGLFSFYPTPFGVDLGGIGTADLRAAASVMLGLWTVAALVLFLGALFGTSFLRRARGAPVTFWRLLWPAETLMNLSMALVILGIAPGLLARPRIEFSSLQLVETLGTVELALIPILGMLAYAYLFREFLLLFRLGRAAGPPAAPAEGPAKEGGGTA